jgi:hypothetical protein
MAMAITPPDPDAAGLIPDAAYDDDTAADLIGTVVAWLDKAQQDDDHQDQADDHTS